MQGQLEAAPSLDPAVAFTPVAPVAGKDSDNITGKTEGLGLSGPSDANPGLQSPAGNLGPQPDLSILARRQQPLAVDLRQAVIRQAESALRGNVDFQSASVRGHHQEGLRGPLSP